MHKGVILLVKPEEENMMDNYHDIVSNFMEPYGDGYVWDWYVIGGRWSGLLVAQNKEFSVKAQVLFDEKYPDNKGMITTSMLEEQSEGLQAIWVELGGVGVNPYNRNTYVNGEYSDDVMPLVNCIPVVKNWIKDLNQQAEEYFEEMLKARENEKANPKMYAMSAHFAKLYSNCKYDNFSFESSVYDITNETNDSSLALKEPEKYWAIIVDMHN